jgi:hypothetical protein
MNRSTASRPLLLNFVREQRDPVLRYRYDRVQRLNVMDDTGVPVLIAAGGMALMKTQAIIEEMIC